VSGGHHHNVSRHFTAVTPGNERAADRRAAACQ
jgi:hypothetical protein